MLIELTYDPSAYHEGDNVVFTSMTVTDCLVANVNSFVFQPAVDAVDAFQVLDAIGDDVVNVNTISKTTSLVNLTATRLLIGS